MFIYCQMMSFWIVLFTVIVSLILLFAIISNGLMICCVAKFKRLRTFTNVFICNLSVSDIILAGVIMPQKLHHVFHTHDFYEGKFWYIRFILYFEASALPSG